MGRKEKTGTDALYRIVLLLLSLANLAEKAAGRSYSVRSAALAYLWVADAEVRDYIADRAWNETDGHWSPAMPTVRYGTDPADALALAVSLRALAMIILLMATQIRRVSLVQQDEASGESVGAVLPHQDVVRIVQTMCAAAATPPRLDTS